MIFYKPDSEDWQLMVTRRNAKKTTGFLILLSIEFRSNYTEGLYPKTDWNLITNFGYTYSKTVIKNYLMNKLILDVGRFKEYESRGRAK